MAQVSARPCSRRPLGPRSTLPALALPRNRRLIGDIRTAMATRLLPASEQCQRGADRLKDPVNCQGSWPTCTL